MWTDEEDCVLVDDLLSDSEEWDDAFDVKVEEDLAFIPGDDVLVDFVGNFAAFPFKDSDVFFFTLLVILDVCLLDCVAMGCGLVLLGMVTLKLALR